MNERIRELARLAKDYAYDNEDPDERTSWDFLFETKFAELIVRSCSNIAAHHNSLDAAEDIMKHFGVQP